MSDQSSTAQESCPICGNPSADRYRPFCTARCKEVDLGRWLKGVYRLPSQERPVDQGEEPFQDLPADRE